MSREQEFIDRVLREGGYDEFRTNDVADLIQALVETGVELKETFALMDLMIWAHRGGLKPHRYYAARWKWSPAKVYRFFEQNRLVGSEAKVKQERSKPEARAKQEMPILSDEKQFVKQERSKPEAEVKQERSSINNLQSSTLNLQEEKDVSVEIVEAFNQAFDCSLKTTDKKRQQIHKRLENFSLEDVKAAMAARAADRWLMLPENAHHRVNFDLMFRNDEVIEKWVMAAKASHQTRGAPDTHSDDDKIDWAAVRREEERQRAAQQNRTKQNEILNGAI